jgi:hypothetical protein
LTTEGYRWQWLVSEKHSSISTGAFYGRLLKWVQLANLFNRLESFRNCFGISHVRGNGAAQKQRRRDGGEPNREKSRCNFYGTADDHEQRYNTRYGCSFQSVFLDLLDHPFVCDLSIFLVVHTETCSGGSISAVTFDGPALVTNISNGYFHITCNGGTKAGTRGQQLIYMEGSPPPLSLSLSLFFYYPTGQGF